VIAQIQGFAVGGGFNITACCDLRIATPDAKFGAPIARTLGNCLSMETYTRFVDLLGSSRVKDLIFRARFLTAEEALAAGYVHEVVPAEEIDARVQAIALELAGHAPITLRVTKEALRRIRDHRGVPGGDDLIARRIRARTSARARGPSSRSGSRAGPASSTPGSRRRAGRAAGACVVRGRRRRRHPVARPTAGHGTRAGRPDGLHAPAGLRGAAAPRAQPRARLGGDRAGGGAPHRRGGGGLHLALREPRGGPHRHAGRLARPGGAASGWMQTATGWLAPFGFSPESLRERLSDALTELASRSAGVAAGARLRDGETACSGLFFALLTLHVVFLHWDRMVAKLEVLSPLRREYTRLLARGVSPGRASHAPRDGGDRRRSGRVRHRSASG
jgi:hypothetical protein